MMNKQAVLMTGGLAIDETGERLVDVRIRNGQVVETGVNLAPGDEEIIDISG